MLRIIDIETPRGDALIDISEQVRQVVAGSGVESGLCALIVPHTTAGIIINSAMDPATPIDILADLRRLTPTRLDFAHQYDTPADAAGHVKSALTGHSVLLAIDNGDLLLGISQSVLFAEFDGPRRRQIQVKLIAG